MENDLITALARLAFEPPANAPRVRLGGLSAAESADGIARPVRDFAAVSFERAAALSNALGGIKAGGHFPNDFDQITLAFHLRDDFGRFGVYYRDARPGRFGYAPAGEILAEAASLVRSGRARLYLSADADSSDSNLIAGGFLLPAEPADLSDAEGIAAESAAELVESAEAE